MKVILEGASECKKEIAHEFDNNVTNSRIFVSLYVYSVNFLKYAYLHYILKNFIKVGSPKRYSMPAFHEHGKLHTSAVN